MRRFWGNTSCWPFLGFPFSSKIGNTLIFIWNTSNFIKVVCFRAWLFPLWKNIVFPHLFWNYFSDNSKPLRVIWSPSWALKNKEMKFIRNFSALYRVPSLLWWTMDQTNSFQQRVKTNQRLVKNLKFFQSFNLFVENLILMFCSLWHFFEGCLCQWLGWTSTISWWWKILINIFFLFLKPFLRTSHSLT